MAPRARYQLRRWRPRDPLSYLDARTGAGDWTARLVLDELLFALRLAERIVSVLQGPARSWPEYAYEWTDLLAQANSGELAKLRPMVRIRARAAEVTRMERALAWQARYLDGHTQPARVLAAFLRCKVRRQPFAEAIRAHGWSRSGAYAARDRGLTLIAQGLNRDGVPMAVW